MMTLTGIESRSATSTTLARVLLALVLTAVSASFAAAASITIQTDGTWLAKNNTPGVGWNTNPGFSTAADGGWVGASVNTVDCSGTSDCIWYDGATSATQNSYFRKTFSVTGPVASGTLIGGIDDDADIWVNGTQVLNDHNGQATGFGPINIAPFLVEGLNLIAVWGWDNIPVYGRQHAFVAQLNIETRTVPEPSAILLLGIGLAALTVLVWRKRLA